jgi:hypothetical protein
MLLTTPQPLHVLPMDPPAATAAPLGDVAAASDSTAPKAGELHATFSDIATKLTSSNETIAKMVADRSPVGTGWSPHLNALAGRLQLARDGFLQARPDESDLGARLGASVIRLAEASGSMSVMARQRATLSEGWTTYLDGAIADAKAAAAMLAPDAPGKDPAGSHPTPPPATSPLTAQAAEDVRRAAGLVQQSIDRIRAVPMTDRGDESTKDARIGAFQDNKAAQESIERHFQGQPADVTSQLRAADANLEDAAWQLAKKPSPDGRFTGVDIPGALRDSEAALTTLEQLLAPGADAPA